MKINCGEKSLLDNLEWIQAKGDSNLEGTSLECNTTKAICVSEKQKVFFSKWWSSQIKMSQDIKTWQSTADWPQYQNPLPPVKVLGRKRPWFWLPSRNHKIILQPPSSLQSLLCHRQSQWHMPEEMAEGWLVRKEVYCSYDVTGQVHCFHLSTLSSHSYCWRDSKAHTKDQRHGEHDAPRFHSCAWEITLTIEQLCDSWHKESETNLFVEPLNQKLLFPNQSSARDRTLYAVNTIR